MIKIIINEDCGNAPKKQFLKDLIIGIVKNDESFISANITDDIHWGFVGSNSFNGIQDVLKELQKFRSNDVTELIVHTIITHGYHGAIDGLLKYRSGKTVAFCDIYQFRASTNKAPVKRVTTYAIELK